MKFSKKVLSQTVTQLCLIKGIDHIVISPGSRNAPLTLGFTEHPAFHNFSIVDERCAAFFALGMAQQLRKPVALVCTSGSALLNYYPAIAEAFYSDIPLVVLSADRPENLIEIGDGQTIRQENVYVNHILYSANCKEGDDHQIHNEKEINIALNLALDLNGPVHINLPFSEPLYEMVSEMQVRPQHVPAVGLEKCPIDVALLKDHWVNSKRKMVLVGVLAPGTIEMSMLQPLLSDESVIVLTETTSNLHHEDFFPAIDQLIEPLTEEQFEALQPDVLLTLGGMVVSKKIKAFLRRFPPKYHAHVNVKKAYDTYFVLKEHFKTKENAFLKLFNDDYQSADSDYKRHWLKVKKHRLLQHKTYVEQLDFSDFWVFATLFSKLKNYHLQLANSTAIRYAQLFDLDESLTVFCNRGTSGIDGSLSTAIGAARIEKSPTIFVTGDLSLFYDSNGLWNQYIPSNFKILLINNDGGGIFRILPHAKKAAHFDTYFETKHGLNASGLCEMYGIGYEAATNASEFEGKMNNFLNESNGPQLLEVFTPSEINDKILLEYFRRIK